MQNFTTLGPFLGEKFVWVVVGGGGWLRVNLMLHFGPNLWDLALDQAEQY